jgi:hypothetical protein
MRACCRGRIPQSGESGIQEFLAMTEKKMIAIAREEERQWNYPNGVVMTILWAFIHRLKTGRTIEEDFFKPKTQEIDYEI